MNQTQNLFELKIGDDTDTANPPTCCRTTPDFLGYPGGSMWQCFTCGAAITVNYYGTVTAPLKYLRNSV